MFFDLNHPAVTREAFELIVKRMTDRAAVRFSMTCKLGQLAAQKFRLPALNIYEAFKRRELDTKQKNLYICSFTWQSAKKYADLCEEKQREVAIEMYRTGTDAGKSGQWKWYADHQALLLDHAMNILVLTSEMFVDVAQLQKMLYECK